jgi:choline kinase
MVPFFGIPLIERQLKTFNSVGINDITIVGGYKAESLNVLNLNKVLNKKFAVTNMVYTLFCAEKAIKANEDLIISYGDILFEPKVLSALISSDAAISVIVDRAWLSLWSERMDNPLEDAETLKLDGDRIIEIGRKPTSYSDIQGQYIGLVKVSAEYVNDFISTWHAMDKNVKYDGKDFDNMYMTSFIQYLIDSGWDIRAAFIDSGWLEVDTVEDLQCYERMNTAGHLKKLYNFEK